MGTFVVDFVAPEIRLVVEVDGRSHEGCGDADRARQAALEADGYRVVRVQNDDVLARPDAVVRWLGEVVEARGVDVGRNRESHRPEQV